MGDILVARCECGYRSRQLHIGFGFEAGSEWIPFGCPKCGVVRAVREKEPLRCPRCGGPGLSYQLDSGDEERGTELKLDALWECPKCGKQSLRFESVGLWD